MISGLFYNYFNIKYNYFTKIKLTNNCSLIIK